NIKKINVNAFGVVKKSPTKLKIIPKKIGFRETENSPLVTNSVFVSVSIPIRQEFFIFPCAITVQTNATIRNPIPIYVIVILSSFFIGRKCLCQVGKKA